MREIYVRSVIEQGVLDSVAGRTMDVREIRAKYGLGIDSDSGYANNGWSLSFNENLLKGKSLKLAENT